MSHNNRRNKGAQQSDSDAAFIGNVLPGRQTTFLGIDEPLAASTVNLQPPALKSRPERTKITTLSAQTSVGPVQWSWSRSTEEIIAFCARKHKRKIETEGRGFEISPGVIIDTSILETQVPPVLGAKASQSQRHGNSRRIGWDVNSRYIVVGIMGKEGSIPLERMLPISTANDLFKQIRKAERTLRSQFRRLLSLKRVGGFSLYKCHPSQDYHSTPQISDETKRCLAELYRNYRTEKVDYKNRWNDWIQINFNAGSTNPEDGVYALQLVLRWSAVKLVIWSAVPIILSLVIGFWYMLSPHKEEDYLAVVQTAWGIASYIVTTAALIIGVVAAISQFGDV